MLFIYNLVRFVCALACCLLFWHSPREFQHDKPRLRSPNIPRVSRKYGCYFGPESFREKTLGEIRGTPQGETLSNLLLRQRTRARRAARHFEEEPSLYSGPEKAGSVRVAIISPFCWLYPSLFFFTIQYTNSRRRVPSKCILIPSVLVFSCIDAIRERV